MDSREPSSVTTPALPPLLLARIDVLVALKGTPRSVTSDDRYHDLRQEVDKLSALVGGEVDWRKIAALGDTLTLEVGKDLGVIAYVALARQRMLELEGMLAGVYGLARLLRAPPSHLTPAKPRGRASAVEWLLSQIQSAAQAETLPPAWAADLDAAVRELRGAAREALGDLAPSFNPVMQALQRLREQAGPAAESIASGSSSSFQALPDAPAAASPATSVPPAVEPAPEAEAPAAPGAACFDAAAAWLAPIDAASPCGVDPAGREAFIDVQDELARLASPSGGAVDWSRVEAGSSAVLLGLSKDLRAAIWFTLARAHRGGPAGLAVGLAVVIGLLETFGEALYPRKLRSIRDQSEWLVKHAAAALAGSPTTVDAPLLATLRALSDRLGVALRTRLDDDTPSLRPLRDVLGARAELLAARAPVAPVVTAEPTPAPEPSPPAAPPSAGPSPAPLAPLPTVVADTADLDKFLGATGEALEQAARTLREVAPADPRAYRLLRTGLWLHLVTTPPLRPDGNTGLPGLEPRDHADLAELASAARWAGLLARSENLLPTRRLALDLQRHTAAALAGLGPEYAAAGEALRVELRALLARLPGLATLRDRDGQPLADADTQRWLAAEVLPRPAASAGLSDAPEDPVFWTDLRPRLRGETRSEALTDAQRHIDAGHGEQQRQRRRLSLAELCDDVDQPLATHLFAALADDLERRDLDAWDPSFGARVFAGLARAQHRARDVPAMRRALHRLARLDPSTAATLLAELPEPRP